MGAAAKIGELSKEKGIALKELSRRADIPYTTLYNAVKRDSKMDFETVQKIADVLDVPVLDLFQACTPHEVDRAVQKSYDTAVAKAICRASDGKGIDIQKFAQAVSTELASEQTKQLEEYKERFCRPLLKLNEKGLCQVEDYIRILSGNPEFQSRFGCACADSQAAYEAMSPDNFISYRTMPSAEYQKSLEDAAAPPDKDPEQE